MKLVFDKLLEKKIYIFFFIIFISYILGFYFNEDSSGGGQLDFEHEWKTFLEFKKGIYLALTSMNYESSRMPLFPILNSFNIFATDQYSFRFSNFIANIFVFFSFFVCLKMRNIILRKDLLLLASSLILLSPYFRSSSYWAHQENLPFFFTFISFSIIYYFKCKNKLITNNFLICFIIAILSSLSFYSDQKFIFVSFFSFIYLFFETNNIKIKIIVFLIFCLTSLPAFYLFFLWGGILPVESQYRIGYYPFNISSSLSIISFYFIPLILFIIYNKKIHLYLKNINKVDILIFLFIGLINYTCIPDFNSSWGYGIIIKLFYVLKNKLLINTLILSFIYFVFLQIFTFFIYIILKKNILNYLPVIIVVILSFFVERTYNEYFDPLILSLIFVFFDFDEIIKKNFDKLVFYYLYFYCCFLIFANMYYNFYNLNPNP